MTDLVVHSTMQLLTLAVLLVGTLVDSHVLLQPITPVQYVSNAAVVPSHFYWIDHGAAAGLPPRGAVSRETLEEHSGEGIQQDLLPDISEEQAHIYPDDSQSQIPSRPSFPSPPRPLLPSLPIYPRPTLPPTKKPSPPSGGDSNVNFNGPQPDGSYDFSYNQDDQSRSEKGDAQGNVEGSYSYTGLDGKVVTITYTAGAGTGYVPVGEGLLPPPQPIGNDGDDNGNGDNADGDDSQNHLTPDDSQHQEPQGGNANNDDDQQEEEEAGHKGMPYSYNYDAHASSKTETADDNGNVKGSYWYIDGAGAKRTVTYTVNGNEGFLAKEEVSPGAAPVDDGVAQRPASNPHSGGGRKGGDIPVVPERPPIRPHPPVKGGNNPPPAKGVKGGTKGGQGWNKYPLGK